MNGVVREAQIELQSEHHNAGLLRHILRRPFALATVVAVAAIR